MTFEDYLKTCPIQSKYLSYYVSWQIQYMSFCRNSGVEVSDREQMDKYNFEISKRYAPWQVEQAGEAVRLFYVYLSLGESKNIVLSDNKLTWKLADENAVKVLRIKQRALSTERSYLGWTRQFYTFVDGRNPNELKTEDLCNFLSYADYANLYTCDESRRTFGQKPFRWAFLIMNFELRSRAQLTSSLL